MTKDEAIMLEALKYAASMGHRLIGNFGPFTIKSTLAQPPLPVQDPVRVGRDFSCKVCGNKPDGEGILEHGKGCYALDKNGGGSEFIADAIDSHLPVQEPVGSVVRWLDGSLVHGWFSDPPPEGTLLYITPPAAQPECARCKDLEEQAYDLLGQLKVANLKWSVAHPWVGLTDEERLEIRKRKWWDWEDAFDIDGFMQAVETKLKEKNT